MYKVSLSLVDKAQSHTDGQHVECPSRAIHNSCKIKKIKQISKQQGGYFLCVFYFINTVARKMLSLKGFQWSDQMLGVCWCVEKSPYVIA
jgi:hypothetical protein